MLRALVNAYRAGEILTETPVAPARPVFAGRKPEIVIPEQGEYVKGRDIMNICWTSRRAGKTWGAVDKTIDVHADLPAGEWTHFVSLVKKNATKHFWLPIQDRFKKLGWGFRAIGGSQHLILRTERDTYIQALGVDDERDVARVQGDASRLFIVDECHLNESNNVLERLIDMAQPMTSDRDGMIDMLGLAPEVPGTFFDRAIKSGLWKTYRWTMFDHDFPIPREQKLAKVKEICRRRGLSLEVETRIGADGRPRYTPIPEKTSPIVLWQYFGHQVRDPSKFAYDYAAGRNDYDPKTIEFDKGEWASSAGLDLGWGDNDAITVASWQRWLEQGHTRCGYTRFRWQQNQVPYEDLRDIVHVVHLTYGRPTWVGDTGGHGAVKVLKSLESKLRMEFLPKPTDVAVSARELNDDYRTGRWKHPTSDTETARVLAMCDRMKNDPRDPWEPSRIQRIKERIIEGTKDCDLPNEVKNVPKTFNRSTGRVEINKKGKHSDISESNRYCHHGSRHWSAKSLVEVPERDRNERRREANAEKARRRRMHNEREDN